MSEIDALRDAILAGADQDVLESLAVPSRHRAETIHRDEPGMVDSLPSNERDPLRGAHCHGTTTSSRS